MKMHDGEADIDTGLVRQLVAAQFPELADLAVTEFSSTGTVNAIYRLGDQLYARLPRLPRYVRDLEREWQWLPKLALGLTLQVPEPVALGQPTDEYPLTWAVYRWIDGRPYADELIDDERQAALDLARFVTELRRATPAPGAPPAGRKPLAELDAGTRASIAKAADVIDAPAALAAWESARQAPAWESARQAPAWESARQAPAWESARQAPAWESARQAPAWESARQAPAWDGQPVWIHSDLLRPNLLVAGGRLRAVIDFGAVGLGDPATDVIPAWAVFGPAGRTAFRDALAVDDGTWNRARGIALHQAAALIPYYAVSNPTFAALGQRTVEQVLADPSTPRTP